MKRLTESDKKWFLDFLEVQIKEAEVRSWRYRTENCYNKLTKLKKIYNILKYEESISHDDQA